MILRNEFQPPSDFTPGPSGSGKKKIWMGLGIGCGLFLLIIGILMAVGTFRAVSCCGDIVDGGTRTVHVSLHASGFAQLVQAGDAEAYEWTSGAFQERTSREQFRAMFMEHEALIKTSTPVVSNIQVIQEDPGDFRSMNRWDVTVRYSPPAGEAVLVMALQIMWTDTGEEGGEYHIDALRLDLRPRVLAGEPPAEAVARMHRQLMAGDYESARRHLAMELIPGGAEGFRAFLDEQGKVFTTARPEIVRVEYFSQNTARVEADLSQTSGPSARAVYELRQVYGTKWEITAIRLERQDFHEATAEPSKVEDSEPENRGEAESNEGEGAAQEDP